MTEISTHDTARLASVMQISVIGAFAFGLAGAFVPGPLGHWSSIVCISLLVASPVLRVVWLTVGWAREGDRRFALLGTMLLMVVGIGALVALLH